MIAHAPYIAGALLALLFAAITVLYDCHVSIQDRLKRVPMPIYSTPQAVCLALVCGVVAAWLLVSLIIRATLSWIPSSASANPIPIFAV